MLCFEKKIILFACQVSISIYNISTEFIRKILKAFTVLNDVRILNELNGNNAHIVRKGIYRLPGLFVTG